MDDEDKQEEDKVDVDVEEITEQFWNEIQSFVSSLSKEKHNK